MKEQLTLDRATSPIDRRFEQFHQANPHVYTALVSLARRWRDAGHRKVGVAMLWEVLRWEWGLDTTRDQGKRLNNDFRSRYARLIQDREPDLVGFFDVRALADERGRNPGEVPW